MSPLGKVSLLTSQYLRKVGLPQAIPMGVGCTRESLNCTGERPIYPDKVRFGFIPDNWFEFFYTKTGKTGPYVFGVGLLNYLFSKEIYVCDHYFYMGISMGMLCVVAVKNLGPLTANYCDREIEKIENQWKKQKADELKVLHDRIDHEKLEQWRAEGSLMLMQVKRENIALQLEAAYREALMNVYKDVKHRLDYQVACNNTEKRISQKHMVTWLVKEATRNLPKNIDSKMLAKHKQDLSALTLSLKR